MRIDLHTHCSPYSSCARQTIDELIDISYKSGVKVLSVTNHNKVKDLPLFKEKADSKGIKFIYGVELTAENKNEISCIPNDARIHILAYDFDANIIENGLNEFKDYNSSVKQKRLNKLNEKTKLSFTLENDNKYIYETLVKENIFNDTKEAKKYVKDINAEVPYKVHSIKEVLNLIHKASGKSFIAHVYEGEDHMTFNDSQVNSILNYLLSNGLDGIEIIHPTLSKLNKCQILKDYACSHNLLMSIGSDRHDNTFNCAKDMLKKEDNIINTTKFYGE